MRAAKRRPRQPSLKSSHRRTPEHTASDIRKAAVSSVYTVPSCVDGGGKAADAIARSVSDTTTAPGGEPLTSNNWSALDVSVLASHSVATMFWMRLRPSIRTGWIEKSAAYRGDGHTDGLRTPLTKSVLFITQNWAP